MKSRLHEAADAELSEAVAYYDGKASGLGDRFLTEVKLASRSIEEYPEIAPEIDYGVRAKVLHRFPCTLMYVIDEPELLVVAIAHQSRRPGILGGSIAFASSDVTLPNRAYTPHP